MHVGVAPTQTTPRASWYYPASSGARAKCSPRPAAVGRPLRAPKPGYSRQRSPCRAQAARFCSVGLCAKRSCSRACPIRRASHPERRVAPTTTEPREPPGSSRRRHEPPARCRPQPAAPAAAAVRTHPGTDRSKRNRVFLCVVLHKCFLRVSSESDGKFKVWVFWSFSKWSLNNEL